MRVMHYRAPVIAVTDHDGPGLVGVEWHSPEGIEEYAAANPEAGFAGLEPGPSGVKCGGWVQGEGANAVLFVPSDGDSDIGAYVDGDGLPDACGDWYAVGTGERALVGLAGSTLAVMGLAGDPALGENVA